MELQRDINELHCLTSGMSQKSFINDILGSNDGALGSAYTFQQTGSVLISLLCV